MVIVIIFPLIIIDIKHLSFTSITIKIIFKLRSIPVSDIYCSTGDNVFDNKDKIVIAKIILEYKGFI